MVLSRVIKCISVALGASLLSLYLIDCQRLQKHICSKSKRELLEERLMQMQLEKELSELW